ncbi:hypothetical protein [Pontibacter virosus]|uniref:Uncharacterized protein n=1 Tax=Pontibacter virosus TaxID=1765052 RepID=A0A2U1B3T7_9BACT|nr:hypothetical protein [Pontibacter virosus]PVY43262.1 hypothetical protein C8E01_102441 [Pontibacter virosus]
MKDRKRDVLKRIMQGGIQGESAVRELEHALDGTTRVTVWIQDPEARLWRKMDSDEVHTYEEHEAERQRDKLNKHKIVITIGGRKDGG